jgi:hypothetical protein
VEGVTIVGGASSLYFLRDTLQSNGGWTAWASFDNSRSQIVDCAVEAGAGGGGWWGVVVSDASVVNMGGTSISGHGNGIGVSNGGRLGIQQDLPAVGPDQTVLIENNYYRGIDVSSGSVAQLGPVARIQNNGDGLGGRVGVMVRESSFLGIETGAKILGTGGTGLAALSNSTITVGGAGLPGPLVDVAGSQNQDIFCDPTAVINGSSNINITGTTKVTCPNLNSGTEYPLP